MKKGLFLTLVALLVLPFSVGALDIVEMEELPQTYSVTKYFKHITPISTESNSMILEVSEEDYISEVNAIENGVLPAATISYESAYESLVFKYTLVDSATKTYDIASEVNWKVLPSHRDYDYMIVTYYDDYNTSTTNFEQIQTYYDSYGIRYKDNRYSTTEDRLQAMGIRDYQRMDDNNTGTAWPNGALFDLYTGSTPSLKTSFKLRIVDLNINKKLCVTHKHKTSSNSEYLLGNTGIYVSDNPGGYSHTVTIGLASQSYNYYEHLFNTAVVCYNNYDN